MKSWIKKILMKVPIMMRDFFVGDLIEEHKTINKELKTMNQAIDDNEKDHLRHEILSFASSLRRGEKHTTQEFETIYHFHEKYEKIVKKLGESNGYTDEEFKYIREQYKNFREGLMR